MLGWWLGRSAEEIPRRDDAEEQEAPETPAPVFAARAIQSAIWGTPAPVNDTTICVIDDEEGKNVVAPRPGSTSPTKGILLTPGTATSRRKTVSFGNELPDKDIKRRASTGGGPKSLFAKQLEEARERKVARKAACHTADTSRPEITVKSNEAKAKLDKPDNDPTQAKKPKRSNQELLQEMALEDGRNADATIDINEPRSQSGKFWKAHFQTYREDSITELQDLLKYKQQAKQFAELRDSQAVDLHRKLKEEQRKVIKMESRISQLSEHITNARLEGNNDDSPELVKELARQTAMALQYKSQVEEFRAALEVNDSPQRRNSQDGRILTSPRTEKTILDITHELRKAREQLCEMSSLKVQLDNVRQSLATSEKSTRKLQEENARLTQEVLHADVRLQTQIEKGEKRQQSFDEQRKRKDEALKALQKDYDTLKESAKLQRRDAEHLLRKRHDQVVELKKEIASMKNDDTTIQDLQRALQKKIQEHDRVVAELQQEISTLKKTRQCEDGQISKYTGAQTVAPLSVISKAQGHESHIPVSMSPISRPSKAMASTRQLPSDNPPGSPVPRSSHSALSEIVNQANIDTIPPKTSGPVQFTPQVNRFTDMSLDPPDLDFPTPEPYISNHLQKTQQSPTPSMFNIPSSPPKPAITRMRTLDKTTQKKSSSDLFGQRQANISTSRLSESTNSSRMRNGLPPERAAAARARLEQKKVEKAKLKLESGKENVRS